MGTAETAVATQYLTYRLGEEIYGLDIFRVREVLDFTTVTKVPRTPDFLRGVLNLRGSVIPVVDLRLKFGMSPTERTVSTCVIITEITVDGEKTLVGALADSVQEVIELGADAIEPPPRIGTRLRTEFMKGIGKQHDRFIIILDIDRVFSTDELALVQGSAEGLQPDRRSVNPVQGAAAGPA